MFNIWVSGFCAFAALDALFAGHVVWGCFMVVLAVLHFYIGYRED